MEQLPSQMTPDSELASKSSLFGRLTNVIAAPGEVFDEVKRSERRHSNWLVPILIVVATTIASFALIFSQPSVTQQIREMQEKALDQQVATGKMKPEQAKQAKEFMEKMPSWVFQIAGIVQGVIAGFFGAFWWALVTWLIGSKFLKGGFPFMKALEVSGLTMIIFALGYVVNTLLVVIMGNIHARPAVSVLVGEFDPLSKLHLLLASINLFYLWATAVLALGVAKLSGVSFGKAALWMFGFWIVMRLALVGAGMGSMVL